MRLSIFILSGLLFFGTVLVAQTTSVTATQKLIVDDNGSVHAELTANPWGGSHGIFFGSKINYTGSDNLWHGGNAVYSHDAGPYNFGAFSLGYIANGGVFGFYDGGLSTGANQPISWGTVMAMTRGGNVGIATESPSARLHVNGDTRINTYLRVGSMPATTSSQFTVLGQTGVGALDLNNKSAYLWSDAGVCAVSAFDYSSNTGLPLHVNLHQTTTYINSAGGQVLIGATGSLPVDYKLGVAGAMIAEKVKVKIRPWPDYVFQEGYQLPSLSSVESYIKQHKHLPGIQPAEVIEKDGLDLGSNQADLLKKIEELTLYLIDQDKRLRISSRQDQELTEKLNQQEIKLERQQAEIDLLKKQLTEIVNKQTK